jgi:hypothetical protein
MSMVKFKPGDTLDWAGQIAMDGVTDFTGYTLKCQFRKKNTTSGAQPTADATASGLLAEAEITWIDAALGTFRVFVDETVTIDWPTNVSAFVDISLVDVSGNIATTETAEFALIPRVTEAP